MATEALDTISWLYSKLGFEPTPEQAVILGCDKRFVLVTGGAQAGKSLVTEKYGLKRILEKEGHGLYWLVAADYERTRAEFEYFRTDFQTMGQVKRVSKRIDPGFIELFDGTRIETKSARDPRTLAMKSPDGILGCEASQLDLETYWKFEERVAASNGWVMMSGTMEGSLGWYPSMAESWSVGIGDSQSFRLPTPSNIHMFPGGENDEKILRLRENTSDDFYYERMLGIPRPPSGRVFPEFRTELHVRELEWMPGQPVYVWIDPGYAGAYAVLAVQIIDEKVRVFDEIYEQGLVTEQIIQICQERAWWKDVNYGTIDIGGTQHQAMAAPAEIWLKEAGVYLNAEYVRINDGIERLRSYLKPNPITQEAKFWVDHKCKGLLSEAGLAPNPFDGQVKVYKWKTDNQGNIVGHTPDDKFNHSLKAATYGLISHFGYATVKNREKISVRHW